MIKNEFQPQTCLCRPFPIFFFNIKSDIFVYYHSPSTIILYTAYPNRSERFHEHLTLPVRQRRRFNPDKLRFLLSPQNPSYQTQISTASFIQQQQHIYTECTHLGLSSSPPAYTYSSAFVGVSSSSSQAISDECCISKMASSQKLIKSSSFSLSPPSVTML